MVKACGAFMLIFLVIPAIIYPHHPNHQSSCDTIIEKDFSLPTGTLLSRRPVTQSLGGVYEIRNNPWPPDPSVITGFYRINPDGRRFVHNALTGVGVEEKWFLTKTSLIGLARGCLVIIPAKATSDQRTLKHFPVRYLMVTQRSRAQVVLANFYPELLPICWIQTAIACFCSGHLEQVI